MSSQNKRPENTLLLNNKTLSRKNKIMNSSHPVWCRQHLFYARHFGTCMLYILYIVTLSFNTSELNCFQTALKFCKYHLHILHSFDTSRLQSKLMCSQDIKKKQLKLSDTLEFLVLHTFLSALSYIYMDMNANFICLRTRK